MSIFSSGPKTRLEFAVKGKMLIQSDKIIDKIKNLQPDMKIKFKENELGFGQDFSFWKNIPCDIEWTVDDVDNRDASNREPGVIVIELKAYGYGILNAKKPDGSYDDKAYGNGSIHWWVNLNTRQHELDLIEYIHE